jgi:hypothetical protein
MSISKLEIELQEALERQRRAWKAFAAKHRGGEKEEFSAACDAVLRAERALAAAKGEQYAVPIDFPVLWDSGAPLPYLLQNDYRTFVTFFVRDIDPNWDGSYVKVRHPDSPMAQKLAVVEFQRCICTKMGTPNDEVFHGHPLHGKGFAGYLALAVENSNWLKELEAINAVHSNYKSEPWRELKHYILPFHDSTFECVARSFIVETYQTNLPQLLSEICRRLIE